MLGRRLHQFYGVLTLAGASVATLVILYLAVSFDLSAKPGAAEIVLAVAALLGGAAVLGGFSLARQHFRQLERLRGALVTLAGNDNAVLPLRETGEAGLEVNRLWLALGDLSSHNASVRARPDERLQTVLAAIPDAIVVVTESGQVSLVNATAKRLLGAERVRVGTSVYAALQRPSVLDAWREAERQQRLLQTQVLSVDGARLPVWIATLGEHGGAVLSFPMDEADEAEAGIEHALDLHDRPPAVGRVGADTSLDDLPVVVVDTETTGLDIEQARIVSIGAVRLHGPRVYRSVTMDRLVRPDVSIPPRSTAVHGITDEMVVDALEFPAIYRELREMLDGTVLVGHNVLFDVAMLERECRRFRLEWQRPPVLDTLLLAGALLPEREDLRLETLADVFQVDVHGRHTALGDCLVTAQVFLRMVPLLHDQGAGTLGAAQALAESRKDLVKLQKASGW